MTMDTEQPVRRLALQGTPNFRDLGGYAAADGRRVKWGYLFRSGQLSDLQQDDQRQLAALQLDLVCDFRREEEQANDPSQLPQPGPQVVSLPISPGSSASFFSEAASHWQADREAMFDFMRDINRDFALMQSQAYRQMFELLLGADDVRMLFHCAAGKDRTGFAAALILLALGVPQETVLEDYMLTAKYFDPAIEVARLQQKYGMDIEAEALLPVLEVHPQYLQAALDAIAAEFTSVDDYLDQYLLLDGERREFLQQRYLE
ncbi:tyrosine-protein phosphatase [Halieaceae bacterium IMCC14734]|uniref:Tyrosine-protein phosphatase n=1 Tax=Candidatus Litorirhabdus singularis TaxID=2518993 RepID=A0ABT3TD32_9GAMM|nr:tyrosine-protein phosphatase [Candidatus Litorirhabdus singularis]MCX2979382.1 tyrosine-protein phosphatase [Candidatus Litorirhabdus singularis]